MGAWVCKDLVWAKELIRKFLRQPGHTEELSLDECLTSDWELGCSGPSGICGYLVVTLGISYVCLKLLVKLIEVCDKVTCARRCKVALRMNGNIWVIAFVGKEGSDSSRSTGCVVVGELG